ncbi:condensation domain-containing protein, partial [Pedobacter psychrotolerans]
MDAIKNLILNLKNLNVQIDVDGEDLRIAAKKGVIDDQLKELIKKHKQDLINLVLRSRQLTLKNIPLLSLQTDYELSSSQRRLWILDQLDEGNVAYNMSGVYVFEDDFDSHCLELSFQQLISRHEILRTVFRENVKGEIRQYILSPEAVGFSFSYHELYGSRETGLSVDKLIVNDLQRPFDLSSGPLLRASVYHVGDHEWIFTYTMHHIISDGWSMGILIREVLAYY